MAKVLDRQIALLNLPENKDNGTVLLAQRRLRAAIEAYENTLKK